MFSMKNIHLKLKDKDFFKLLRIKNNIVNLNHKKITWEDFILIISTRRLNKANGNK